MQQDNGATSKEPSSAVASTLQAGYFFVYLAIFLIIAILIVHATRNKQEFFVTNKAGQSMEIFPLDRPNVTPSALTNWATQAATSAYTLDFYQYQDNIDSLRDYFTVSGYQAYLSSLEASNSLKRIVRDKLIVSAVATGAAVILQEGPLRGVYTWRIQVPLLLTYQGASTDSTQKSIAVSLLVTRVPTEIAPKGIGIEQIVDSELYGNYG